MALDALTLECWRLKLSWGAATQLVAQQPGRCDPPDFSLYKPTTSLQDRTSVLSHWQETVSEVSIYIYFSTFYSIIYSRLASVYITT
jgi:hypothetical protein